MKDLTLHNGDFVPLDEIGTDRFAYGGKQAWFAKKSRRVRGCGPTAAANILCYLAGSAEKYRPLCPDGATRESFLVLMDALYTALAPSFIGGLFSRRRFSRRVVRWAQKRGVALTAHQAGTRTHSQQECLAMIRHGLEQDRPVATLNLKWRYIVPGGEDFGWHWVTITGLQEEADGKTQIVVSSWGRRFLLDWNSYWQACRRAFLPGGFVWFE